MTFRPRHLPVPLAFVAAAALAAPGLASEIDLHLHNNGTTAWTQTLDLSVAPAGSVAPMTDGSSPLTLVDGSGFDQSALKVFLASGTYKDGPNAGQPVQLTALDFGTNGLAAGGDLNFTLNLASGTDPAKVSLSLPPDASPALSLDNKFVEPTQTSSTPIINQPSDGGSGSATAPPQTPEPASLALWASLAGLGLFGLHARRRSPMIQV